MRVGDRRELRTWTPTLLVGADGMDSVVREALRGWDEAQSGPAAERFKMVERPSASAGLRYKVLILPPNPEVQRVGAAGGAAAREVIPNPSFCAIAVGCVQSLVTVGVPNCEWRSAICSLSLSEGSAMPVETYLHKQSDCPGTFH